MAHDFPNFMSSFILVLPHSSFLRKTVYAQLGTMQMCAVCYSQLTQLICWLLALLIVRPIVTIFAMLQFLGAYWLDMRKLLAMLNSWMQKQDAGTLVSASTDYTLKIWDLNRPSSNCLSKDACVLTLRGHTNEKNFVGLSAHDGYITCGSETNEAFAYYKSLPMPITAHKFGSIDSITGKETEYSNGQFVSSVCWRGKSNMVVAANSSGCIKLLQMV